MKVLIVDDDALIRDSLKMLLEMEEDFQVMGTVSNGEEAFSICKQEKPDIVLMDIRMPVMDGVLGTQLIKQHFPDIRVVILTTFKDIEYIRQALKNGAEGYILKSQPADSIVESIRTVAKGNIVLERDIGQCISFLLKEEESKEQIDFQLTQRELDVLQLIGEGLSNREIASNLYLSEGTVRNYVTALLEKLNLRDRTQLAIFYLKKF